jgi:hypothetical protein
VCTVPGVPDTILSLADPYCQRAIAELERLGYDVRASTIEGVVAKICAVLNDLEWTEEANTAH